MKRYILIIGLVAFFAIPGYPETYDFRKVKFGWTMEQVSNAENMFPDYVIENSIVYKMVFVDNIKFMLSYDFVNNKLYQCVYETEVFAYSEMFRTWDKIQDLLEEKYGAPVLEGYFNPIAGTNIKKYDTSLDMEEIAYLSVWTNSRFKINHGSGAERHFIYYIHSELESEYKKEKKKKSLGDL